MKNKANEAGPIAENYETLQGIPALRKATAQCPLPKASHASVLRSVFQCAEVALLNLCDLTTRATIDLRNNNVGAATKKVFWSYGFHHALVRLSMIPHQFYPVVEKNAFSPSGSVLCLTDSPAAGKYREALEAFDKEILACSKRNQLSIDDALSCQSLESASFNLLHRARLCNHEATIWEYNLAAVYLPGIEADFQKLVAPEGINEAVFETTLKGDTFLTQFRGLHQIPELLAVEANDRIEETIIALRNERFYQALEYLSHINLIVEVILACMPPISENLATSDYHRIRENLGLTSGSHSIALHYELMTDLHQQLWRELSKTISALNPIESDTERAHINRLLVNECMKLRAAIAQWREQHLHLPRNNLGGNLTKSLIGSEDAVTAVTAMRDHARRTDPWVSFSKNLNLPSVDSGVHTPIANYIVSNKSLDSFLLKATGEATQRRFPDVQSRSGYFKKCPFAFLKSMRRPV